MSGSHRRPTATLAILLVLVATVVAGVHWPVLSAGAVSLDDARYLFENYTLQAPSWASAKQVFVQVVDSPTIDGYYEPLTLVSLMGDVALGGRWDNLRPFHRTNLVLHVLNTALVVVVLYMLFGQPWPTALAGLLFGLHPLTVEPVAWVWERKTLLAAFLALWCLILYVRFVRRPGAGVYVACLAMFVLALLAKPTTTPLPVLLLLLDFWPLRRLSRRTLWEKVPFFVVAGLSAAVTIASTQQTSGISLPGEYSVAQLPLRICYLLIFYMVKIVWPVRLSSVYVLPEPLALSQPLVLGALITTGAIGTVLAASLRWTRAAFCGAMMFVVMISPTLGFIGYSWVTASDKYVYLPAIGLLAPLAYLLSHLWAGFASTRYALARRAGTLTVVLMLSGAEAIATRSYLVHWRDSVSFFEYMLTLAPNSVELYTALGDSWARQNEPTKAIEAYRQALRIQPDSAWAHLNLAEVLTNLNRLDEAVEHLVPALKAPWISPQAHNNLAVVLARKNQTDQAIDHLTMALRLKPNYLDARRNLGILLARTGRNREAISQFSAALQLNPNDPELHNHLAVVLMMENMPERAVEHYRSALRSKPDSPGILRNLAWILATSTTPGVWRPAEAVHLAERACALDGAQEPATLDTLAAAYAAAGRFDRAVPIARKALELAAAAGKTTLAAGIGERLQLYSLGMPFRQQPGPGQP